LLGVISIDRSLIKGEALRFLAAFTYLLSCESPLSIYSPRRVLENCQVGHKYSFRRIKIGTETDRDNDGDTNTDRNMDRDTGRNMDTDMELANFC
jgi:hypothetical protein